MNGFYTYIDKKDNDKVISFLDSLEKNDLEIAILFDLKEEMFFLCAQSSNLEIKEVNKVFPYINVFNCTNEIKDFSSELYMLDILNANIKREEWYDIYSQIINEMKQCTYLETEKFIQLLVDKVQYYFDNFNNLINNIDDTIFQDIEKDDMLKHLIIGLIINSILFLLKNNLDIKTNIFEDFYVYKSNKYIEFMQQQSVLIIQN